MNEMKIKKWYDNNHRKLAFRETKDPYAIWVSEIMAQQTQVETVLLYFTRFIKRYPTINDLAEAPLEEVLKMVEGLGYYRRFRNMHQAAIIVKTEYQGQFPKTYQELLKLPGIGHYTAGAIMSIAYEKPYSALDGNVIRVLSRYFNIDDNMRLEKHRKKLNQINQEIIETMKDPNIYTQSMMEIGALICRPTQVDCNNCPLKDSCLGFINDNALSYPILTKLEEKKEIHYQTFVLKNNEHYVLRKRDEKLLEGFYEFPQVESESVNYAIEKLSDVGLNIHHYEYIKTVKHVFTHQIWVMDVYQAQGTIKNETYYLIEHLNEVPMATAHKKVKL